MTQYKYLKNRYITQMSELLDYNLQLYDCEYGEVVAQFKDKLLAEQIKEMLNETTRRTEPAGTDETDSIANGNGFGATKRSRRSKRRGSS